MNAARLFCLIGVFLVSLLSTAFSQPLPPPDHVLAKLRLVNDRFMAAWPEPERDIVTDRARPSNIWTRSTYFESLMALHAIAPEERYYRYAVRWAEGHRWNLAYGSTTNRNADDQCCGQTYLALYAIDPRPERIANIKTAMDNMVNSTKVDDWWWIDALHMAMPVFARLSTITNDPRYLEKMHALYWHTKTVHGGNGLYNPVEHLWWRDADFDPPYAEPNGAHCYWSRGNGWVFAALVRVLDVLPADSPHRAEYLKTFQEMAAALLPLQRADGFWNASLTDPGNYGGRELTGTGFFTYGMAWGINQGLLPRATYLPAVAKAWRGLSEHAVHPGGKLGYVQGTGKQPSDGQPVTYDSEPNFDDFGTGAFLLAGTEVYKLTSAPSITGIEVFVSTDSEQTGEHTRRRIEVLRFEARVQGTGLAAAFANAAPRVIAPDGAEFPLTLDPPSGDYVYAREATFAESPSRMLPNGSYAIKIGSQTVGGIRLGTGIELFAAPLLRMNTATWGAADPARPVILTAAPEAGRPLSLTLSGPGFAGETASTGGPVSLTVPAYSLQPGETYQVTMLTEGLSYSSTANLGALGSQVPVVAGYRGTTRSSLQARTASHSQEKLLNISSRGFVPVGGDLSAGFVVSAGGPKMLLVRGVGPSLQTFGVANALANPFLRIVSADRTRTWQNDDWQSSAQYAVASPAGATVLQAGYSNARDAATAAREAGAFPLSARSRDAVLVVVLPPGNYTAQLTGAGNTAGSALVEVYELPTTQANPRLTNLSTRGMVSAAEPITAGFVITGGTKNVLVRAIGPSLTLFGVPAADTLRSPRMSILDASGAPVGNVGPANGDLRARVGAFPLPAGGLDAEAAVTLAPGAYTVQVSGTNGSTGMVLVELYVEPPGS